MSNRNIYAKQKYYLDRNAKLSKEEYILCQKQVGLNQRQLEISQEIADNYDALEALNNKLKLTPCKYTEREQRIIDLLKQGKTIIEIAKEIGVSYSYVTKITMNLPK
jgi:DNA-binding NarL/FixJ family response regulator